MPVFFNGHGVRCMDRIPWCVLCWTATNWKLEGLLCQIVITPPVHTICFCCSVIPAACGGSFLPSPHIRGISLFSYALLHQSQPESIEILLCYFSLSSRALRSAIIVFATTFWSSSSRCLKRRKTCSSPPASFTFDTSKPIR